MEAWLKEQPVQVSVALAGRAALRVLPQLAKAIAEERFENVILLPVFHGTAISALAGTWPKAASDAAGAAYAAAYAAGAASDAADAAYAASDAAYAASDAAYAASDAAGAAYAADAAARAAGAAAYAAARAARAMFRAVSADASFIESQAEQPIDDVLLALAHKPLWQGEIPPKEIQDNWTLLKRHLIEKGVSDAWKVWTDWYQDRVAGFSLSGRPAILELELARVERLTIEDWQHDGNPGHVLRKLAKIEAEFRQPSESPSTQLPDRDENGRFLSRDLPEQSIRGVQFTEGFPVNAQRDAAEIIDLRDGDYFHRSIKSQIENLLNACKRPDGSLYQDSQRVHQHGNEFQNALGATSDDIWKTVLENEERLLNGLLSLHDELSAMSDEDRRMVGNDGQLRPQLAQILRGLLGSMDGFWENVKEAEAQRALPDDDAPTAEDRDLADAGAEIASDLASQPEIVSDAAQKVVKQAADDAMANSFGNKAPPGRPFGYLKGTLENIGAALGKALVSAAKTAGKVTEKSGALIATGTATGIGLFAGQKVIGPAALDLLGKIASAVGSNELRMLADFLRALL